MSFFSQKSPIPTRKNAIFENKCENIKKNFKNILKKQKKHSIILYKSIFVCSPVNETTEKEMNCKDSGGKKDDF